jgi:hypothetical protein
MSDQSQGRAIDAEWRATPSQVKSLLDDAYKPNESDVILLRGLLTAIGFVAAGIVLYSLVTKNMAMVCSVLQLAGLCK